VTEASHAEPRPFADIEDVLAMLRDAGHRVSAPCRGVLYALFAADGPISAQAIMERGAGPGGPWMELASVYRNLERLEALGVVRHVHLGHSPGLYMLVGGGEREFLSCERCGRVESVEPAELDAVRDLVRERFGYEARFGHFPIVGRCADCR
jgi:Fur family ferric uptake transcriptional regulator